MNILGFVKNLLCAKKSAAFIDGDQDLQAAIAAHNTHIKGKYDEIYFVRLAPAPGCNPPKLLKKLEGAEKIFVEGSSGKEVVDKFIAGYIHRAVSEGFTEIAVLSNDFDFIDIFKMAAQINPRCEKVTFRLIAPKACGRLKDFESSVTNIEVVK